MTDTELLDFCDAAFKRNAPRRKGVIVDIAIGDISVMIQSNLNDVSFRDVIKKAVQQRVRAATQRLTR